MHDDKLTDNNQSEYALEREAKRTELPASDDNLTSNTSQPGRRFSDDMVPPAGHTPKTTTTGSTTLPPDLVATTGKPDLDQQSAIDTVLDPPFRNLRPDEIFPHGQAYEEDPPATLTGIFKDNPMLTEKGAPSTPLDYSRTEFEADGSGGQGMPRSTPPPVTDAWGRPAFVADEMLIQAEEDPPTTLDIADQLSRGEPLSKPTLQAAGRTIEVLRARVLVLESQLETSQALEKRLQFRIDADIGRIQELRTANLQLLDANSTLLDQNHKISRERHELAKALESVNSALHDAIEHLKAMIHINPKKAPR